MKPSKGASPSAGIVTVVYDAPTKTLTLTAVDDATSDVRFLSHVLTFGSTVAIKGGANADAAQFSSKSLTIGDAVTFDGLAGTNFFRIDSSVLALKKAVTVTGGDGADQAVITGGGSIKGDVMIDLGGSTTGSGGFADVSGFSGLVGILKLGGALTVKSTAAAGVGADVFASTDISVTKAITVALGDAGSLVTMDNFSTKDNFSLTTGKGTDAINIEQGNFFGGSLVGKIAKIVTGPDAGDGNDIIKIGKSAAVGSNDFVKFLGAASVDGGVEAAPGDTINTWLTENVFLGGAGTQTHIP